jgi:hypothetical protein
MPPAQPIACRRSPSSTTQSRYGTTWGSSKMRAAVSNETPCFRRRSGRGKPPGSPDTEGWDFAVAPQILVNGYPSCRTDGDFDGSTTCSRARISAVKVAVPEVHANKSRPLGSGIGRPSSRAVSNHSAITTSTFARASWRVAPSAAQPANSGTSATNASSSWLQYRTISYLVIGPLPPVYIEPALGALVSPGMVSPSILAAGG